MNVRVLVALVTLIAGSACSGSDPSPETAASPRARCLEWLASGAAPDVPRKDRAAACAFAGRRGLVSGHGEIPLGARRLVRSCLRGKGCALFERGLREDPRFERLSPEARHVLLVGVLEYSDENGVLRPYAVTQVPGPQLALTLRDHTGVAAWSLGTALSVATVERAVSEAEWVGLIRAGTVAELLPRERCRPGGPPGTRCSDPVYRLDPDVVAKASASP